MDQIPLYQPLLPQLSEKYYCLKNLSLYCKFASFPITQYFVFLYEATYDAHTIQTLYKSQISRTQTACKLLKILLCACCLHYLDSHRIKNLKLSRRVHKTNIEYEYNQTPNA